MGQVLRASARTTEAVRRAIQLRQDIVRALAKRFGVSPTTVQKWRKRTTTADARMGPKEVRSTVLTPEEDAMVVAFRRHALLGARNATRHPTSAKRPSSAARRAQQRGSNSAIHSTSKYRWIRSRSFLPSSGSLAVE